MTHPNPRPPWIPWQWREIKHGTITRYLGIPFGIGVSLKEMWSWFMNKLKNKFLNWTNKFLSMVGRIQIANKILLGSHVYISSCWLPSQTCYTQLTQLIRRFLWSKWGNTKSLPITSWSHCIQPRDKGGLGIIDPYTQGICLNTKWIVRALEGDTPWKHLVRYRIQTATAGKSWHAVSWQDKVLLAPYFKTHGSAPFNSIWRAWQITSKKLCWYDRTLSHGLSFASSSIWWNRLVHENNRPLAILKHLKGRQLFKKGICVFRDLWDPHRFDWKSWEQIKSQFNLSSTYRRSILQILHLLSPELLCLMSIPCHDSFLKDWRWPNTHTFQSFPLRAIYNQLIPTIQLSQRLNTKWQCNLKRSSWNKLSALIWKSKADAQAQPFSWKILHVKIPIGDNLSYINPPPSYPFCRKRETIKHAFWFCPHAQKL